LISRYLPQPLRNSLGFIAEGGPGRRIAEKRRNGKEERWEMAEERLRKGREKTGKA